MEYGYDKKDRGFAFVVAVASFLSQLLQYGIAHTVGVFFAIFVMEFPGNSGAVAFISSLNTSFFYGAGPVVSILTNRFGCRKVTIIGGIIGCIGMSTSSFATSIYHLYFTFGIVTGLGIGLAYLPSITILTEYFDKWRSTAIGFAAAGVGLGQFIYPPLIRHLVNQYGWRGALLILGAITSHICIFGILFKPFQTRTVQITSETDLEKQHKTVNEIEITKLVEPYDDKPVRNDHQIEPSYYDINTVETTVDQNPPSYHELQTIMQTNEPAKSKPEEKDVTKPQIKTVNSSKHNTYISIVTKPSYILLCLNAFGLCFGMSVVYIHLAAYAESNGVEANKSAMLYTIMGLSNFIGRFTQGLFAQLKVVKNVISYSVIFAIAGVATCICTLHGLYYFLVIFAVIYGFCTAAIGPLIIEVTIDIVGVENVSFGYGFVLIFEALGVLIGAPVAGWLYEYTEMYNYSFYLSGSVTVISSVIITIPLVIATLKKIAQ